MKKRLYFLTTIILSVAVLSFSSCLKDSRFVDLSKVGTIVEFPFGGQVFFNQQAVTTDTAVIQFAVNVASPTVPTTATTVTFDVDNNSTIQAYVAANPGVSYVQMPSNAYVFTTTSVTIPAGQRSAALTVTIYKNVLDPSQSYMLPITIKSAGGLNISGNQGTLYYHVIGNTFAGNYIQTFHRFNLPYGDSVGGPAGGSFDNQAAAFAPISPTEFQVPSGYAGGDLVYDVTFSNAGGGNYNNFNVSFTPASVTVATGAGITVTNQPIFSSSGSNTLPGTYTKTAAQALFDFQFGAMTSAPRYLVDYFKAN